MSTDTPTEGDSQGDARVMRQVAPYPEVLAGLVDRLHYRADRGWSVWLTDDLQRDKPGRHSGEARGLTLVVQRFGPNSYQPGEDLAVNHYFPVPAATYNEASWTRWLFDRLGDVDTHERMEDFVLSAGDDAPRAMERPYAPIHKPGYDPYIVHELSTYAEVDTDFRGRRVHPEADAPPERG